MTTTAELFAETETDADGAVLHEAGAIQEATVQPKGKGGFVVIDLIREGFGNKRDGHYYSRDVLREAADQFVNAQMYSNHIDPETEAKLKGLPRPPEQLLGRIRETWIDTDDAGKTVIRGKASVSQPWAWNMIEHDPELLGVSINARGKSRVGMIEGQEAKIVEGIHSVRSVDWVTRAGAGGKVVSLVEAQIREEDEATTTDSPDEETPEEAPAAPPEQKKAPKPKQKGEEGDPEPEAEEPQGEEETQEGTCAECGAEAHGRFCSECGAELVEAEGEEDPDEEPEPEDEEPDGEEKPEDGEGEDEEPDEAAEALFDVLGNGELDRDDLRERIAFAIETRATQLAEAQLNQAIDAAVSVAAQEFEAEKAEALREQDAMWERKLGRVTQGAIARSLIDTAANLPDGSRAALREQFHDCYFEDTGEGEEAKSGEDVCRETVKAAIDKKRAEVQSAIAESGGHAEDGGPTGSGGRLTEAANGDRPKAPSGGLPRRAPLDEKLDRSLGIEKQPKAA